MREFKPKNEYYRDKIDYCEKKLLWLYEQMLKYDPDFKPNFVLNEPIKATIITNNKAISQ